MTSIYVAKKDMQGVWAVYRKDCAEGVWERWDSHLEGEAHAGDLATLRALQEATGESAPAEGGDRYLDRLSSAERKQHPMASGLLDYFPDALAVVANVSYCGNEKHNPGEPLHHARGKSEDHADCIMRHHSSRGGFDAEGVRHSASLAWRALALLQEELEAELDLPLPRGAR